MSTDSSSNPAYLDSVALTQRLVRFDTTNPPGNEVQCIEHIKALLDDAGERRRLGEAAAAVVAANRGALQRGVTICSSRWPSRAGL